MYIAKRSRHELRLQKSARRNHAIRNHALLQTVSENARLDVNSPGGDDDLELWDQSGFMLRNDMDDPLAHAKYVSNIYFDEGRTLI